MSFYCHTWSKLVVSKIHHCISAFCVNCFYSFLAINDGIAFFLGDQQQDDSAHAHHDRIKEMHLSSIVHLSLIYILYEVSRECSFSDRYRSEDKIW